MVYKSDLSQNSDSTHQIYNVASLPFHTFFLFLYMSWIIQKCIKKLKKLGTPPTPRGQGQAKDGNFHLFFFDPFPIKLILKHKHVYIIISHPAI